MVIKLAGLEAGLDSVCFMRQGLVQIGLELAIQSRITLSF